MFIISYDNEKLLDLEFITILRLDWYYYQHYDSKGKN